MSQYQRQRLSEEDFQRQVEEYYKAKEAYNEIVSKLPIMPDDQGDTVEKGKATLQSAANEATQQTKATAQDHKAGTGPVIPDKMPEAASREELKARAEELNKK